MQCLLLKAFLVMLMLTAVTFGQDKSDTQMLRFSDGGPDNYNPEKYAPVIEALDKALAAEPNNAIHHYDLGMTYYNAGDFAKAATSFRRFTELQPDIAVGYNQLGVALLEGHRDDEALKAFTTALKLKPGDPVMMVNAGFIYVRLAKFKEAIELFEKAKAAKEVSNYPDFYVNLGYAYAMRKRYNEALEVLNKAVELDPKVPEPQYFLGIVYLWSNHKDEAIKQQKVVEKLNYEIGRKLFREIYKDKLVDVADVQGANPPH